MSVVRWVAVATLGVLAGCRHPDNIAGRCNVAADCGAGLTCDNTKTCVPTTASSAPCSSSSQCGTDYACDNLGWCVCQNQNMSMCGSGGFPIYRGVEHDGGMPDGSGGAGGSGGSAGKDGGHDMGVDVGFVCKSNTDCSGLTPVCDTSSGVCVGCQKDMDCATATKPVCDTTTNECRGCKADSECASTGPGVCMFQSDGHCATVEETLYVQPTRPSGCVGTATPDAGTAGTFCSLSAALASRGTRDLIVVRGPITDGAAISGSAPLNIVGQMSAAISVSGGQSGLHVTGADLYVRSLAIGPALGAVTTIGIIADGNATLRLDGVDIENMSQGGLRVTSSSYDVINSIFASNGGTRDDGNRFIGGAWLLDSAPDAGASGRFAFNTVVNNKRDGVTCASTAQAIDATLLAGNFSGLADNTGCGLAATSKALGTGDPMLTATYRATATSPCVDFVTTPPLGAPDHDIDAVTRPQGAAFDCGASEYKAP